MQHAPDDLSWVGETRVPSLTGVARTTFQSWTRAGIVDQDPGGAYGEGAVLEIALVGALREHFSVDELATRWSRLRSQGDVNRFLARARQLDSSERFDLVVEPELGGISVAADDEALVRAVRHEHAPRAVVVIPMAERLTSVRDSFRGWSTTAKRPTQRKRGRPARRRADLKPVRGGA